jgi:hypothetical protein
VENASDGCWSPDGRYFVYMGGSYYGIYVRDTGTGETRQVSHSGTSPTVTPDGASIIYVDWRGGETDQLFRTPLAGGNPEQLTFNGFWWNPICSSDGEWILCSGLGEFTRESYTRLRAFNLFSRRTYDIFIPNEQNTSAELGDWSPSGLQFCYTLTSGKFQNGKNIRTSSIHIDDFNLPRIAVTEPSAASRPLEFRLIGNYPNPFNPFTTIRFSLPAEGRVELDVYSMNGQKIRALGGKTMPAGTHSILWDGRDSRGNPVSSGVYISRLMMEGKVETRRMTLVK